jgi:hypothetical protein
MQKNLACRGSANSETVCFKLNRYAGQSDLFQCHCIIKTKNSEGKSDLVIPEVTADSNSLNILWSLSSGATAAAGTLLVQLQFEKVFDDSSKNIVWQSNIMEFEIWNGLEAANEIADQEPTLFQQWEEKVNTLYSDTAADVQTVQALQSQVQAVADTVVQQKQSVEQTAVQVMQNVQSAADSAGSAAACAAAVQAAAEQAQASAQSAQASAQSAQRQADAAQQKVDDFSGYTKEEINNGFANTLTGEVSGQSITLNDVVPNTNFSSLLATGQAVQTATQQGKNLFDASKAPDIIKATSISNAAEGSFTLTDNKPTSWGSVGFTKHLTPNAAYSVSWTVAGGNNAEVIVWNSSGGYINGSASGKLVVNIPSDGVAIFYFYTNGTGTSGIYSAKFSNIQLELGVTATAYAPFVPDRPSPNYPAPISGTARVVVNGTDYALPQTLYCLPDGTADSCDIVSGIGTQSIGKIVLNGSETGWEQPSALTTVIRHSIAISDAAGDLGSNNYNHCMSDRFLSLSSAQANDEEIGICLSGQQLWINIPLSMGLPTLAAWKTWLSANPVTILYKLASAQAINGTARPMSASGSAQGITLLANPGSLKVKYCRDINAAYQELLRKIEALNQ